MLSLTWSTLSAITSWRKIGKLAVGVDLKGKKTTHQLHQKRRKTNNKTKAHLEKQVIGHINKTKDIIGFSKFTVVIF